MIGTKSFFVIYTDVIVGCLTRPELKVVVTNKVTREPARSLMDFIQKFARELGRLSEQSFI